MQALCQALLVTQIQKIPIDAIGNDPLHPLSKLYQQPQSTATKSTKWCRSATTAQAQEFVELRVEFRKDRG